jgi:phytol kinase
MVLPRVPPRGGAALTAWLPPFGSLAGELARLALVVAAFGALFATAELWRRHGSPPVEWTRKLVHMGGGVISGTFPWAFSSQWSVLAIALGAVGAFALGRRHELLQSVTAVERRSRGEVWFPIGVYLLFVAARQNHVFWLIALSALVFADTAAALIGRAYGRFGYAVGEDRKSLEGSLVFMLVTFLAVHIALLLGTSIDRAGSLLVAAQIALLVASFEAISMRGNDNIVVPLGTYYLLLKMTPKPPLGIAFQLASQVSLLAVTSFVAWRTRFLTLSGAVAAHLVLYAAYSLGGVGWTLAPLGALAGYLALDGTYGAAHGVPHGGHQVRAIYYTSIVGVLALFADNSFATLLPVSESLRYGHPFHPLFVGAFASPLAIVAWEVRERVSVARRSPPLVRGPWAIGTASVCVLLPGLAVLGPHATVETIAVAGLVPVLGLALHVLLRERLGLGESTAGRLRMAALATLLATLAALVVHFAWADIRPWAVRP